MMPIEFRVTRQVFEFRFTARTSRGEMPERICWFIHLQDHSGITGIGEVAPIFGLSRETVETVEGDIAFAGELFSRLSRDELPAILVRKEVSQLSPSVRMGLEMAVYDLLNGGVHQYFDSPFWDGVPLPINGLVWMDTPETMQRQAFEKLEAGFSCIKIKVGAHTHEAECAVVAAIRSHPIGSSAVIRLDANGAFVESDFQRRLADFANFGIHSIEQPVRAGQPELMRRVCECSPIPVALDEELIGSYSLTNKIALLDYIRPGYVVLKPSLLGGFAETRQWIESAERLNIGWWITSALESPLGLHAIAQFTSLFKPHIPQGLGTGAIFRQEISSPLIVEKGQIRFEKDILWGF